MENMFTWRIKPEAELVWHVLRSSVVQGVYGTAARMWLDRDCIEEADSGGN